jgi:acyl-CoA dehydrogenase
VTAAPLAAPSLADLRARARRFVDESLIPNERELSATYRLAPGVRADLEARARELGLWNINTPAEFGGPGLGVRGRVAIWEELGRTIALPPRNRGVMGPEVSPILFALDAEQRRDFLEPVLRGEKVAAFAQTEPGAGSDPAAMTTAAVRDGDAYVINGRKHFIGFVDESDFIQVFATTDPAKGARGITAYIVPVDAPGLRIVRQMTTMMRDRPFEIAFDDVRVPLRNRIGNEGQGFAYAQSWITEGRLLRHAARGIGVIERCLELAATYAKSRTTFGAPLAERQSIQWMLVDMYTNLRHLRLLTYDAAQRYDAGEDVRYDSYICKYFGDESAFAATDRCLEIYGGIGLTTDYPIETMWRDQRSFVITEGPTEVLKMALVRHVLATYGNAPG